jgi:hypothetical protein
MPVPQVLRMETSTKATSFNTPVPNNNQLAPTQQDHSLEKVGVACRCCGARQRPASRSGTP